MPRQLDHERINRTIKGKNGTNQTPFYERNQRHPRTTPKMIKYIEDMCKTLDEHGVTYQYIFDDPGLNWKFYREDAGKIIRSLKTILNNNGIVNERIRVFFNLVKDSHGKKYVYATHRFAAHPKGFEFVGMLRKETVLKDEFYFWPKEKILQEYNGVG